VLDHHWWRTIDDVLVHLPWALTLDSAQAVLALAMVMVSWLLHLGDESASEPAEALQLR